MNDILEMQFNRLSIILAFKQHIKKQLYKGYEKNGGLCYFQRKIISFWLKLWITSQDKEGYEHFWLSFEPLHQTGK